MKKAAIILLLSIGSLLPAKGDAFLVSAGAGLLVPADGGFADLYGKLLVGPDLQFACRLYRDFHARLGVGFFTAKGTIPVVEDEASASQALVSLGIGWETRRVGRLQGDFHLALLLAATREKALGDTTSKMAPGFDLGAELRTYIKQKVFLEMALSWSGAWTTMRSGALTTDVILGGLRLGCRVGVRF
jgi:hypothetical protein